MTANPTDSLIESIAKIIVNHAPNNGHWSEWCAVVEKEILPIIRQHEADIDTNSPVPIHAVGECIQTMGDGITRKDVLRGEKPEESGAIAPTTSPVLSSNYWENAFKQLLKEHDDLISNLPAPDVNDKDVVDMPQGIEKHDNHSEIPVVDEYDLADKLNSAINTDIQNYGFEAEDLTWVLAERVIQIVRPYLRTTEPVFSDDQCRVAKYLNINPERIGDSLMVINALLDIEKNDGKEEMMNQISKMQRSS